MGFPDQGLLGAIKWFPRNMARGISGQSDRDGCLIIHETGNIPFIWGRSAGLREMSSGAACFYPIPSAHFAALFGCQRQGCKPQDWPSVSCVQWLRLWELPNKDHVIVSKRSADYRHYQARMQRVLTYIDQNLDGDLCLRALSAVAAFSPCHFHRQFSAVFGLSLHRYVQLIRMKRASWRLAYRGDVSVTEIALDAGYETPDGFARAFHQRIGQAPKAFRENPDWVAWAAALGPLAEARNRIMTQNFSLDDVTIREEVAIPVAFMTHRGAPERLGETIRRFISWRKANGVRAATHATYTIFHTDPDHVPEQDYRIDLAAATTRKITLADEGVEAGQIPAGRCAVLRLVGESENLRHAAQFLYGQWLPASGEELRDFPFYAQRVKFFPDVPEHEAITDLYLPLK